MVMMAAEGDALALMAVVSVLGNDGIVQCWRCAIARVAISIAALRFAAISRLVTEVVLTCTGTTGQHRRERHV